MVDGQNGESAARLVEVVSEKELVQTQHQKRVEPFVKRIHWKNAIRMYYVVGIFLNLVFDVMLI